MFLSDISVKRPVLASVVSLLLVAFGMVSFDRLSLREYPDIDPPIVSVEVEYPGASANVVETRITQVIEDRIAGIEGIEAISSTSKDGQSNVTIEFSITRDIDDAANDVRDRIGRIADNLPDEAEPPQIQKADSNNDVIIWRNLTSNRMTVPQLTDYARRFLVDQYSTLDGVARVRVGGGLNYAMRIWLDRQELAARGVSVSDVEQALRSENVELPAGSLESEQLMFRARVDRNFKRPEDFAQLVIAQGDDGYLIRLGDIARVELGVVEDRTLFRGNEVPMVGIGIVRQSNANTIDVANEVIALTERLNKNLPDGMTIEESYNAAVFIEASIAEVYKTLGFAIVCVIIVIYFFLGSVRAMLIPAVTVPISLVSTFIIMYWLGFSVNLLTLLAMVLAIGLVVDDAIVMLENIVRRMQTYGESPLIAAYRGARQVGFAVIATTLVLVAVFVPITFLEGDIGRLFTEFALTIVAAVCFSSFVALTLCPMMAANILAPADKGYGSFRIGLIDKMDQLIDKFRDAYIQLLTKELAKPVMICIAFGIMLLGTVIIYPQIDQEFTPYEDRGAFFVVVSGPEGASYAYMKDYMEEIEQRLMKYVDQGEFKRLLIRAPRGFGNIENFNSGFAIVILEDWSQRRPASVIMNEVRKELSNLPGIRAFPVMRQGLGGGTSKPVQFVLGGTTYETLAQWRDIILQKVEENNPGFEGLDSDYKETKPQIDFQINYDRAADLGVQLSEIGATLQTLMGGRNVTTYIDDGEEYDVIVEGDRSQQRSFTDVSNIYVRSHRTGQLVPLSNLVDIQEYGAAQTLSRYNRIRSITLDANLKEGYRLGEALAHLESLVKEHLPSEAIIDYRGQSRDFKYSGNSVWFVFILGVLVVFLVLAAQFESYIHPFVIMLTVPLAMGGGLLGLYLFGYSINIYSQIGLIMLVGLSAKNGILIVEFANQLRDQGVEFQQALIEAATTRFRPIIMTGLTTIAGSIPLILSSGAGSETRVVIGVVIFTGVIAATLFTLVIVPVAYQMFAKYTGSPGDVARKIEDYSADK